jgi:hypothetical protein
MVDELLLEFDFYLLVDWLVSFYYSSLVLVFMNVRTDLLVFLIVG